MKSWQNGKGLKRSKTLHRSSVSTQVRSKRPHSCQRRRRNQRRKLLDQKGYLFVGWNGISITQGFPSINPFIFKSIQCIKSRCECKTWMLWRILAKKTALWKDSSSNLFRCYFDYFVDMSSTYIDLHLVDKKSYNEMPSFTDGISYENYGLHNLFRQISVYINGTLMSTSNNLSNCVRDIQSLLMTPKSYKEMRGSLQMYLNLRQLEKLSRKIPCYFKKWWILWNIITHFLILSQAAKHFDESIWHFEYRILLFLSCFQKQ